MINLTSRTLPPGGCDQRARRGCPVTAFAERYLLLEPSSDLTSDELWIFYSEVAASGEVGILSKPVFLRRLTPVMDVVFGVRKCHSVVSGKRSTLLPWNWEWHERLGWDGGAWSGA